MSKPSKDVRRKLRDLEREINMWRRVENMVSGPNGGAAYELRKITELEYINLLAASLGRTTEARK